MIVHRSGSALAVVLLLLIVTTQAGCSATKRDSAALREEKRLQAERQEWRREERASDREEQRQLRQAAWDEQRRRIADIRDGWFDRALRDPRISCIASPYFDLGQAFSCSRPAVVSRVIDGDTLSLKGGSSVRLVGINTPELFPRPECGAVAAAQALRALMTGPKDAVHNPLGGLPVRALVQPAGGHPNVDAYGRLLRKVEVVGWQPNRRVPNRYDDVDLGDWLLWHGYARFDDYAYSHYFGDSQQRQRLDLTLYGYRASERWAMKHHRGLWGQCWAN